MTEDSSNNLRFHCPKCRKEVSVVQDQAGSRIGCPSCQKPIMVPGARKYDETSLDDLLDLGGEPVKAAPTKGSFRNSVGPESDDDPVGTEDGELLSLSKDDYIADVESPIEDDPEESVLDLPTEIDPISVSMTDLDAELESDEAMLTRGDGTPEFADDNLEASDAAEVEILPEGDSETDDNMISDADVQLMDDDDLLDIDEPMTVSKLKGAIEPTLAELSSADPFKHDEFSPLSIDGITLPDNAITTACKVCGTRIDAKPSEIGSKKKCPDCYSMVEIEADQNELMMGSYELKAEGDGFPGSPEEKAKTKTSSETQPKNDSSTLDDQIDASLDGEIDDGLYGLAPLEENDPVDTRLFTGDDDPLKKVAEMEARISDQANDSDNSDLPKVSKPEYDLPGGDDGFSTPSFGVGNSLPPEEAIYVTPEEIIESATDTPIEVKPLSSEAISVEPVDDWPIEVSPVGSSQSKEPSTTKPSTTKGSSKQQPTIPTPSLDDTDPFGDDLFGDSRKKKVNDGISDAATTASPDAESPSTSLPENIEKMTGSGTGDSTTSQISDSVSDLLNPVLPDRAASAVANPTLSSKSSTSESPKLGHAGTANDSPTAQAQENQGVEDNPAEGDLPRVDFEFVPWLQNIAGVFANFNVAARAIGCAVLLAVVYIVVDWGVYFLNLQNEEGTSFFGFLFMLFIAAFAFAVSAFLSTVFASIIVEYEIGEVPKEERWKSLMPDSVMSNFMALGPGIWLGTLPGALLGMLFFAMTQSVVGLYLLMLISTFTLAPLVILSSVYNEHPLYLFSKEAMSTLQSHRNRWLRFYMASFSLFVLLLPLCFLLFIDFFVVSIFVALATVAIGFVYAKMFAIHMHDLLEYLGRVRTPRQKS